MPRQNAQIFWRRLTGALIAVAVVFVCLQLSAQDSRAQLQLQTLATFGPHIDDGAEPTSLAVVNGFVYGTTASGGEHGHGTVFVISPWFGRQRLYSFTGEADGGKPLALVAGRYGALYGLSSRPGALILFYISPFGRIRVLREFDAPDGVVPSGALTRAADGSIFGSSAEAGATLFRIGQLGDLTTLYTFPEGPERVFAAAIAAVGGTLYGSTSRPLGPDTKGTLFRLGEDGVLTTLHSFEPINDSPAWSPVLTATSEGTLYGVVRSTGSPDHFYRCESAADCEVYSDADDDGALELTAAVDGRVFGARSYDDAHRYGSVFELHPDGSVSTLYAFAPGRDVPAPSALIYDGAVLYGARNNPRSLNGSVFRLTLDGVYTELANFVGHPFGMQPSSLVHGPDERWFGAMGAGGANNAGTVFSYSDRTGLRVVYDFLGLEDGAQPTSLVFGSDGQLYGRTALQGGNGFGTFFRLNVDSQASELALLRTFEEPGDGEGPAPIEYAPGQFYVADRVGWGRIVRLDVQGDHEVLHTFGGLTEDGSAPSSLLLAADGGLYGTTLGAFGPLIPPGFSAGTVFQLAAGDPLRTLVTFGPSGTAAGFQPAALIQTQDGRFYAATSNLNFTCSDGLMGTIARFTPQELPPVTVYEFDGAQGVGPALLVQAEDGRIYGATRGGPGYSEQDECVSQPATVFELEPDGDLVTQHRFGESGSASQAGATLARPTALVGGPGGTLMGLLSEGQGTPAELFQLFR